MIWKDFQLIKIRFFSCLARSSNSLTACSATSTTKHCRFSDTIFPVSSRAIFNSDCISCSIRSRDCMVFPNALPHSSPVVTWQAVLPFQRTDRSLLFYQCPSAALCLRKAAGSKKATLYDTVLPEKSKTFVPASHVRISIPSLLPLISKAPNRLQIFRLGRIFFQLLA